MTNQYHEQTARKFGFKPWSELSNEQRCSIATYNVVYYNGSLEQESYFWKESSVGDNNWISYDVREHNRLAAPHLKG